MNSLKNVKSVPAPKVSHTRVLAAVLALTGGANANAQVTSADIVDGQVKTPDIASAAVTSGKIAGNAVTGAKIAGNAVTSAKVQDNSLTGIDIQDGSITGADIAESTLENVDASELSGFQVTELARVATAGITNVIDLPDCNPGLIYLTKTMTFPFNGSVVVNAMFTAQVNGSLVSKALAARVELANVTAGIWAEGHTAYGSPSQRSNLNSTELFPVGAGANTFVLRVCDSSDTDQGASAIRGKMTFIYTPFEPL